MKVQRRHDRGHDETKGGKYALVRLRDMRPGLAPAGVRQAFNALTIAGVVDFENPGDRDEFFAIKLKDRYAQAALLAYADAAQGDDPEYAADVRDLARRAGPDNPHNKIPD